MRVWIMGGAALGLALAVGTISSDHALAQEIDPEMRPLPGQYQSEIKLLSMDIPGIPTNMVGMMRGTLERKMKICITAEEVEEGFRQALKKTQDGECQYNRFSAADGKIDAEMVCQGETGPMTMQMTGTGTPTSSDVTMQMTGDMGTGPGSMKMRVIQTRIGDC